MMRTALTIWQTDPITVEHGDIFQLGRHRLMAGDATNSEDVARLMQGQKAVLCMADPPYGMGKEKDGVANDNLYREKLDAFQMQWWNVARPHLTNNASAYIWGNAESLWRLWYSKLKDSERLTFRNEIVWDKQDGENMTLRVNGKTFKGMRSYYNSERCLFFMLGEQGFNENADNYWEGWEPIRFYLDSERLKMGWSNKIVADWFGFHPRMADHWFSTSQWSFPRKEQYEELQRRAKGYAFKRDYDTLKRDYDTLKRDFLSLRAYFDNTHDLMTDVWNYSRVTGKERYGHPTPKPVAMIERIIKTSSPLDSLIYDPFLGSGTTLIAGHKTGRIVYGCEVNEAYCETIIGRWQEATGQQAQRVEVTTP